MSSCAGNLYHRAINEPEYDGSYGDSAPCYSHDEVSNCGGSELSPQCVGACPVVACGGVR